MMVYMKSAVKFHGAEKKSPDVFGDPLIYEL